MICSLKSGECFEDCNKCDLRFEFKVVSKVTFRKFLDWNFYKFEGRVYRGYWESKVGGKWVKSFDEVDLLAPGEEMIK